MIQTRERKSVLGTRIKKKIFIVDDHPLVRRGYAYLLGSEDDLEICGEAETGTEALEKIQALKPDLVISDLELGNMSGLELIKNLRVFLPDLPVLVVSVHDENIYAGRAVRAGARGYLMKENPETTLLAAIRRLLSGGVYLSDNITKKILLQYQGNHTEMASPIDQLSDRELEVFHLYGQGLTTREIGESLHISPKTVITHRSRIKEKLAIRSNAELVQHALQWGRTKENGSL